MTADFDVDQPVMDVEPSFKLGDAEMAEIGRLRRPDGRVVNPPHAPKWDN